MRTAARIGLPFEWLEKLCQELAAGIHVKKAEQE
jgi:hypothetical protein